MKVMVSGTRSIKTLPQAARDALDKIIALGFELIVGDCYGVDDLVQRYLKTKGYAKVTVYHINQPRHTNSYPTRKISGSRQDAKDRQLCSDADYGLAVWDGVSKGTKANITRVPKTKVVRG